MNVHTYLEGFYLRTIKIIYKNKNKKEVRSRNSGLQLGQERKVALPKPAVSYSLFACFVKSLRSVNLKQFCAFSFSYLNPSLMLEVLRNRFIQNLRKSYFNYQGSSTDKWNSLSLLFTLYTVKPFLIKKRVKLYCYNEYSPYKCIIRYTIIYTKEFSYLCLCIRIVRYRYIEIKCFTLQNCETDKFWLK